jgi:putative endonuclease
LSSAPFTRNEKQPVSRFGYAMFRWFKHIFGFASPADNSGARGESHAADWLQRTRGFVLVVRNWRDPRDRRREIDLVCRDGEVLVFVEVKARAAGALVPGYFAVNRRKKKIMRRAIDAYLSQLTTPPRTFRFDIVEIVHDLSNRPPEVLHFENIPLFPKHYRG